MRHRAAQQINEIVFVHPSLLGGGAERVAIALAAYFVSRGIKFTFLLTKSAEKEYEIPRGVNVIDEYASPENGPIQQILLIHRFIRRHPNAAVISFLPHQNMYTVLASIGLPNRVILSVRNDPRFDFPGNRVLTKVRNALYGKADAIVFQTREQASLLPKAVRKHGRVILNPISSHIPSPYNGLRRKAIVTSGRLEKQKNHEMTIRAFAKFNMRHPDYVLEIFGEGSLREQLGQLAKNLGIEKSVLFKGFSSDAIEHVRTASVFVMSSRFEGLSNSMIEALCMGVPTICTRCMGGGAEALIDSGRNGFLVNVDDVDDEARLMHVLVTDCGTAQSLSSEAQKLRNEVEINYIGKQWEELICSV